VSVLVAIVIVGLLGAVILLVGAPLRAAAPEQVERSADESAAAEDASRGRLELDELEAERESKYREIRDSELDYRTGKLSREDYETIDAQLRAEALEILNRLERAGGKGEESA
jgi:flagellar biosynthesis/type III secretory pathway M-ring protein FliF/YscJ